VAEKEAASERGEELCRLWEETTAQLKAAWCCERESLEGELRVIRVQLEQEQAKRVTTEVLPF